MGRGFLSLCGAALIFIAGWKSKEKADDIFGVPKPATVLPKVSQFWDDISGGGATDKKPLTTEEIFRRREAEIKAELPEEQLKAMAEVTEELRAEVTEELKKLRDERLEDHQNSRPASR